MTFSELQVYILYTRTVIASYEVRTVRYKLTFVRKYQSFFLIRIGLYNLQFWLYLTMLTFFLTLARCKVPITFLYFLCSGRNRPPFKKNYCLVQEWEILYAGLKTVLKWSMKHTAVWMWGSFVLVLCSGAAFSLWRSLICSLSLSWSLPPLQRWPKSCLTHSSGTLRTLGDGRTCLWRKRRRGESSGMF